MHHLRKSAVQQGAAVWKQRIHQIKHLNLCMGVRMATSCCRMASATQRCPMPKCTGQNQNLSPLDMFPLFHLVFSILSHKY